MNGPQFEAQLRKDWCSICSDIIWSPAAVKEHMSCAKCGLCAKYPRDSIIGFPAHGMRKSNVDRFIQLAEEVNG